MYEHTEQNPVPRLCLDGVLCGPKVWNLSARGEVVERLTSWDFSGVRSFAQDGRDWRVIPLANNWQALLDLPFLPDEDKDELREWVAWRNRLPVWTSFFLADRGGTRKDPRVGKGKLHQQLVEYKRRKEVRRRKLSFDELERAALGLDVPLTEEVEVVEEFPIPRYEEWYRYLPASRRPYSQQVLGAECMYRCRRLPVWYTMRTGKTPMTYAVANRLAAEGEVRVLLVVAPRVNLYTPWVREANLMGWTPFVLEGTLEEDEATLLAQTTCHKALVLVNYERVASRQDLLDQYLHWPEVMMAADESSAIKNPAAQRTQAIWQLGWRPLAAAYLLNGTPIEQGVEDCYSQVRTIDKYGLIFGSSFSEYAENWLDKEGRKYFLQKHRIQSYQILVGTTSIRCTEGEADQFNGRSQQFSFHVLPPTPHMMKQARNIEAGFVDLIGQDEDKGKINRHILSVYSALRELACGVSKYKLEDHLPYQREWHEVDPKSLWIEAFFAANPTQPVVFFLEFNEHELILADLLQRLGISYRSMKGPPSVHHQNYVKVPWEDPFWLLARNYVYERARDGYRETPDWDLQSQFWRWDPDVVSFAWRYGHRYVESRRVMRIGKALEGAELDRAFEDFNEGRVQVFFCKHDAARGFDLNRRPAVARGESVFPDIISLAPPWKLGAWQQANSRCMTDDPRSGRSVCTPIRVLTVGESGLEARILQALRGKKDVQELLLQDAERAGYSSFISDLVDGMEVEGAEFQHDLMVAKIVLGYAPYQKLNENSVFLRLQEKLAYKTKAQAVAWFEAQPKPEGRWCDALRVDGELRRPQPGDIMGFYHAACVLLAEIRGEVKVKEEADDVLVVQEDDHAAAK